MPPSQAFAPPREFEPWVKLTRQLLKSIEKSGQIVNGPDPSGISPALALAAIEVTHGMLIIVGLAQGRTFAELQKEMPAPVGKWHGAS